MNKNKLIETHCHLDTLKSMPLDEIIESSRAVNIEKIITIAVEPGNLDRVLDIANGHRDVYCSQGIHPHEAHNWHKQVQDTIEINVKRGTNKVVAIGEIGLDYHYDNSPRDVQRQVFETQLQLSIDYDLPVIIHSREADDDAEAIIRNFSSKLKRKGVFHSFTSGQKLANYILSEGFYLGFNGIITFKNAESIRDTLRLTPIEQLLIETDAPYLTPVPHRGKENLPIYLPHIIEKMADVKKIDLTDLSNQVYQNTQKLFFS